MASRFALGSRLALLSLPLTLTLPACESDGETLQTLRVDHVAPTVHAVSPQPTDPTDPVNPTDPVHPTDPADPTDPVNPTDPTDPINPTDPTEPLACPPGAVCVDTFPFIDTRDTAAGTRTFDAYSCSPATNEGGPEVLYQVTLTEPGLLVASVSELDTGVDVDVHILSSKSPSACLDRGHWDAAALLAAGTYFVVVDSWVSAGGDEKSGAYTLTLGLTRADDFEGQGLDSEVLATGLYAFATAWNQGDTDRLEYSVIDFSLHNKHPRFWTIDLRDGSLVFAEPVTHGAGSQDPVQSGYASSFSNINESHQSSLGMMRTATRYISGSNGLSLLLDGLEPGINDLVRPRAIVMHSDAYASAAYIAEHGRMGNSWGCQVVDPAVIEDVIGTLEGGALLWTYYPDDAFLGASTYLEGFTP